MNKNEFRNVYLKKRNSLSDEYRRIADCKIFEKLITCEDFVNSDLILVYVSVGSEINTADIIRYAFENGKRVAVPYCRNGRMDFYEISSIDELNKRQFNIPTVDIADRVPVSLTKNTLCIVPALCVDSNGNRIGYGGGYYDRFLSSNRINHICLVRKDFILESVPAEEYDFIIEKTLTDS